MQGKQFKIKRFICHLLDQEVTAAYLCLLYKGKWVRKLTYGRSGSKNLRNVSKIIPDQLIWWSRLTLSLSLKPFRNLSLKQCDHTKMLIADQIWMSNSFTTCPHYGQIYFFLRELISEDKMMNTFAYFSSLWTCWSYED